MLAAIYKMWRRKKGKEADLFKEEEGPHLLHTRSRGFIKATWHILACFILLPHSSHSPYFSCPCPNVLLIFVPFSLGYTFLWEAPGRTFFLEVPRWAFFLEVLWGVFLSRKSAWVFFSSTSICAFSLEVFRWTSVLNALSINSSLEVFEWTLQ